MAAAWRLPRPEGHKRVSPGTLRVSDDFLRACLAAHGNAIVHAAAAMKVGAGRLRTELRRRGIRVTPDYSRRSLATLSTAELKQIHDLNHRNTTPVAEILGISKASAWRLLRQRGLPTVRGTRHASWNRATLYQMYVVEEKSSAEIAAIYGVTPRCVVYNLTKHGVPRRPGKFQAKVSHV